MNNKNGQAEMIYMILTIAIAVLVAAGVVLFGRSFSGSLSEDLSNAGLEFVSQELEAGLVQLKQAVDTTGASSASLKIDLPERIGDKKYTISAANSTLIELRTIGDPSTIRELKIRFWPGIRIAGLIDSTQGSVTLNFTAPNSIILE